MWQWALDKLLKALQRNCKHPGEIVTADLLEGDGNMQLKYCKRCGAYRRSWMNMQDGIWTLPDPDFTRDLDRDLQRALKPFNENIRRAARKVNSWKD